MSSCIVLFGPEQLGASESLVLILIDVVSFNGLTRLFPRDGDLVGESRVGGSRRGIVRLLGDM